MYLKKIDIHGFKSFADRVKLEFLPGINAIVGPNGSGKSNIIDAIRWVLGEQRVKSIRGSKLEDVIFAGSVAKKPMGMAEVSLTLDNTDNFLPLEYSEVCITRKAFRSGESEFYINKIPCRLKDIQELLMDTGIGKDGYSIISQGQVDKILTCRPQERRVIFEEAAGIMKHKTRKQDAEKHLNETMSNIERIDDILLEIQKQLGPLAEQRQKALEYKELSLKYRKTHINILLEKYIRNQNSLGLIQEEMSKTKIALDKILCEKKNALQQSTNYAEELDRIQEKHEKAQKDLFLASGNIKELEKDFQWSKEEDLRLREEYDILSKDIEVITKKIQESRKRHSTNIQKLEEKTQRINQLKLDIKKKIKDLTDIDCKVEEKQNAIEDLKSNIIELLNFASERRNMVSSLNTMKQNLNNRLKQISREKTKLDTANDTTNSEIDRLKTKYRELSSILEDKNTTILELEEKINQKKEQFILKTKELTDKQRIFSEKVSKYRALKDINDNFEGYNYGVRNLLKSIKKDSLKLGGIYGAVADVISVDKKYEVAIETALGAALQNIVCKSEEVAKLSIEFLNERRLGRATFLPLTSAKSRSLNQSELEVTSMNGCISIAENLVSYNAKFEPVIKNLLGRVIVAKNIDSAIKIAQKCKFSLKIVTIDGEIIHPGGAITGGSRRKSSQILTRKRQLIEHKSIVKDLKQDLKKIQSSYDILDRDIESKKTHLLHLKDTRYNIKSNIVAIDKQIQEINKILNERNDRKNLLEEEKGQIKVQVAEIKTELQSEKMNIQELEKRNLTSQDSVKRLQEEVDNIKKKRDALADNLTEQKIELASLVQEEKGLKQQLQSLLQNINSWSKELDNLKKKQVENKQKRSTIKDKIKSINGEIKDTSHNLKELESKVSQLKDKRLMVKKSHKQTQENITNLTFQQKNHEESINKYILKKTQLKMKFEQIKDELWEKYSITVQEALETKNELDFNKAKKILSNTKKKIESLGYINLQAIEDYEKTQKRFDFLKNQRQDLINAKCDLDVLIKEIIKTMEEMLTLAIKQIQQEFSETFRDLFGGGKAELVVEREQEQGILEAGIDIIAQPPGKKLQNLSLLSGGERALTAIALLFAILNTKKTPFCILDEIEAALDDANIHRFSSYLKRVSKHTQFIIITHRRGTMEVANALYGISMEETAVSKILSVKLN